MGTTIGIAESSKCLYINIICVNHTKHHGKYYNAKEFVGQIIPPPNPNKGSDEHHCKILHPVYVIWLIGKVYQPFRMTCQLKGHNSSSQ